MEPFPGQEIWYIFWYANRLINKHYKLKYFIWENRLRMLLWCSWRSFDIHQQAFNKFGAGSKSAISLVPLIFGHTELVWHPTSDTHHPDCHSACIQGIIFDFGSLHWLWIITLKICITYKIIPLHISNDLAFFVFPHT